MTAESPSSSSRRAAAFPAALAAAAGLALVWVAVAAIGWDRFTPHALAMAAQATAMLGVAALTVQPAFRRHLSDQAFYSWMILFAVAAIHAGRQRDAAEPMMSLAAERTLAAFCDQSGVAFDARFAFAVLAALALTAFVGAIAQKLAAQPSFERDPAPSLPTLFAGAAAYLISTLAFTLYLWIALDWPAPASTSALGSLGAASVFAALLTLAQGGLQTLMRPNAESGAGLLDAAVGRLVANHAAKRSDGGRRAVVGVVLLGSALAAVALAAAPALAPQVRAEADGLLMHVDVASAAAWFAALAILSGWGLTRHGFRLSGAPSAAPARPPHPFAGTKPGAEAAIPTRGPQSPSITSGPTPSKPAPKSAEALAATAAAATPSSATPSSSTYGATESSGTKGADTPKPGKAEREPASPTLKPVVRRPAAKAHAGAPVAQSIAPGWWRYPVSGAGGLAVGFLAALAMASVGVSLAERAATAGLYATQVVAERAPGDPTETALLSDPKPADSDLKPATNRDRIPAPADKQPEPAPDRHAGDPSEKPSPPAAPAPRVADPKPDAPKAPEPKEEPAAKPKVEDPKIANLDSEPKSTPPTTQPEAPKPETPKPETPKPEAPKTGTSKPATKDARAAVVGLFQGDLAWAYESLTIVEDFGGADPLTRGVDTLSLDDAGKGFCEVETVVVFGAASSKGALSYNRALAGQRAKRFAAEIARLRQACGRQVGAKGVFHVNLGEFKGGEDDAPAQRRLFALGVSADINANAGGLLALLNYAQARTPDAPQLQRYADCEVGALTSADAGAVAALKGALEALGCAAPAPEVGVSSAN